MSPAEQIAQWADQLRDMSALGLQFSDNLYDRENYTRIQQIAMDLLALATATPQAEIEPLRAPIFNRPTPLSTGDAAIIDTDGAILLIRRADDNRWAMPGGALTVGETPAEGAAREALEETGVRCEPMALVGVHDSWRHHVQSRHQLYSFTFLCRPLDGKTAAPASHAHEVVEIGWFKQDALPDEIHHNHALRINEAYRVWHGDPRAFFDR